MLHGFSKFPELQGTVSVAIAFQCLCPVGHFLVERFMRRPLSQEYGGGCKDL